MGFLRFHWIRLKRRFIFSQESHYRSRDWRYATRMNRLVTIRKRKGVFDLSDMD